MNQVDIRAIGKVVSPLASRSDAPRQSDEGAPAAWLVFEPAIAEGLRSLKPGDRIILITWLDRANRETLTVHPRGDLARPPEGVFSTRSADRPNPIGLHEVTIEAVEGNRVRVRHLEAIDGTPILDVKSVLTVDIAQR
jgi:tRNA-Thr(GGU) m(6)t(6)A37 methyltransferase TsaA